MLVADGSILSNISMDAVQEFRTELLGYSAEFGRGAGGVINLITRSGTNQLHGTAFWYYRNQNPQCDRSLLQIASQWSLDAVQPA
jgi:hypothetical protein